MASGAFAWFVLGHGRWKMTAFQVEAYKFILLYSPLAVLCLVMIAVELRRERKRGQR